MKPRTKMIKVLSRGWLTTSRGQVYAPIIPAYREELGVIFQMLARENATIVEILRDGSECKLTIHNFDKNNEPVKPVESKPVIENPAPPIFQDNSASIPAKSIMTEDVAINPSPDLSYTIPSEKVTACSIKPETDTAVQIDSLTTIDSEHEEIETVSDNGTPTETMLNTIIDPEETLTTVDSSNDTLMQGDEVDSINKTNPAVERFNNGEKRRLSKSERKRLRNQQKLAEAVESQKTETDIEPIE